MKLELSQDEVNLLEELIGKVLKGMPVEIHHCRSNEFKEHLVDKEKKLEGLLKRLAG